MVSRPTHSHRLHNHRVWYWLRSSRSPHKNRAAGTVLACYALWGMSTHLAILFIAIYYHRLIVHKLPPREIIVSCLLPVGPLGFGGYTWHLKVFPAPDFLDPMAGHFAYNFGAFVGFFMWSFGLVWLVLAYAAIIQNWPFSFNMDRIDVIVGLLQCPWDGVYVAVILLWVVVAVGTVKGAWSGELFAAPCLKDIDLDGQRNEDNRQDVLAASNAIFSF
ncbi:voltage-dependent anion channel-domain-containing protein [Aspergillus leporis]|uniref:Voltage-dependent anion channel-domain-containing protein n=1 Tax=Aspergillus leporis TaxID=41062 RepID=A0A5N5WVK2_9EURO|nr:voltage-dependent anion channel-domain-containing protein [Aspergillus leporis]